MSDVDVATTRYSHLLKLRELLSASMDGRMPSADEAADLRSAMFDLKVRDAFFIEAVIGNPEAARKTLLGDREAVTQAVSVALNGAERPDTVRLEAAYNLMVYIGDENGSPSPVGAAAYTLAAFAAWYAGLRPISQGALGVALGLDPEYRFALLLRTGLAIGMPPGWLR